MLQLLKLTLLLPLFLTFACVKSYGQNDEKKFIQFVFTNLETREQAVQLNDYIKSHVGVYMSRCDINSKKFLMLYYSDSDVNLEQVENWMQQYSMEFKCTREGIHGVDQIIDQTQNCDQ